MLDRIEVGRVEAYHETTHQATVRLAVDVHEDHHLILRHDGGELDLGQIHIEGSDEVEEGDTMALDVPQPVSAGDRLYRVIEEPEA